LRLPTITGRITVRCRIRCRPWTSVGDLEVAGARQRHGEPAVAHPWGEHAFTFVAVA